MVADIVGSSLILQQDRFFGFDLYGTFQSIMLPVIETGGGFDVEFTGDDVSAKFPDPQSAVKTGLAIHKTLASWNSSRLGPALAVRIGIHASTKSDETHQRILPLVIASRLQTLGRADALCVTPSVIDHIDPVSSVHLHYLGEHPLCHNFITPLYYLLDERPTFPAAQRLLFERLRHQYKAVAKFAIAAPAIVLFILVAAMFFVDSTENRMQNIEIVEIKNFDAENHADELNRIRTLLSTSLAAVPGMNVVGDSEVLNVDIQLVCSFQQRAGKIRLTWGIFEQDDRVQVTGGDITGKTENLAHLQRQLVHTVISHLKES